MHNLKERGKLPTHLRESKEENKSRETWQGLYLRRNRTFSFALSEWTLYSADPIMSGHSSKLLTHQPCSMAHKGCVLPWFLLLAPCIQEIWTKATCCFINHPHYTHTLPLHYNPHLKSWNYCLHSGIPINAKLGHSSFCWTVNSILLGSSRSSKLVVRLSQICGGIKDLSTTGSKMIRA